MFALAATIDVIVGVFATIFALHGYITGDAHTLGLATVIFITVAVNLSALLNE